jgi:hypothetical protein
VQESLLRNVQRACLAFAADRERGTMIVPPAA